MNFIADSFKTNSVWISVRTDGSAETEGSSGEGEERTFHFADGQRQSAVYHGQCGRSSSPDMDITRAKFDQLTSDLVQRTIDPMKKSDGGCRCHDERHRKGHSRRRFHTYSCCTGAVKKVTGKERLRASIRMNAWQSAHRFRQRSDR